MRPAFGIELMRLCQHLPVGQSSLLQGANLGSQSRRRETERMKRRGKKANGKSRERDGLVVGDDVRASMTGSRTLRNITFFTSGK